MDRFCEICGTELINGVCPKCLQNIQAQGLPAQMPQINKAMTARKYPSSFNRVEAARIMLKILGVTAAIFALIGSIGFLVAKSKITSLVFLESNYNSSITENQVLSMLSSFFTSYDFARFGAVALVSVSTVLAALNRATGGSESGITMLTTTASGFGFASVFLTSFAILASVLVPVSSVGRRKDIMAAINVFGIVYTITMILIMFSAVAMIASFIVTIYRRVTLGIQPASYGYPQQGYPQQGNPEQQNQNNDQYFGV